jgi:RimJ/RimL family protein N-acetyltransferase
MSQPHVSAFPSTSMLLKDANYVYTPRTILCPLQDSKMISQLLDHQSIRSSIFIKTHKERLQINDWSKETIKDLVNAWINAPKYCGVFAIQTNLSTTTYPPKNKRGIGIVSILPSGNDSTGILLDVLIHPDFVGMGFATECAKAVLKDLFSKSPYQRVSSIADRLNTKWIRVLEKLGLRFDGHCRVGDLQCQIFSITKQEFFDLWIPEEEFV